MHRLQSLQRCALATKARPEYILREWGQRHTLVRWGLPSKLTKVALFSVYAEPGRMMSALSAPLSP